MKTTTLIIAVFLPAFVSAQGYLKMMQGNLDKTIQLYEEQKANGIRIDFQAAETFLAEIRLHNTKGKVDIAKYESTLEVYQKHNDSLDSAFHAKNLAEKKVRDSIRNHEKQLMLAQQKKEDSIMAAKYAVQDAIRDSVRRHNDSLYAIKIKNSQNEHLKECIRRFGKINGELIANGQVKQGFTKEMCEYAWGNPRSVQVEGITEIWWYQKVNYLKFKDGKLYGFHASN